MENAVDGLKIGFALIVFVTAIATLFVITSQSRVTADTVYHYADRTKYYDHYESNVNDRIVGVSDVISTLYRYYNESLEVDVKFKTGTYRFYKFDIGHETIVNSSGNPRNPQPGSEYLQNISEREKNLGIFINKKLLSNPNRRFRETFLEIPTSGVYMYDEFDGSELTIVSGSKKIHITYDEI